MTVKGLIDEAEGIAQQIGFAEGDARAALHEQLHRQLLRISAEGGQVPPLLKQLDFALLDEEAEAYLRG